MAEQQQSGRLPSAPSSGSTGKADSKLRLVGTDGKVVVPSDARPTDAAPTVISKKGPKSLAEGIIAGDNLSARNLYGQRLAHFELLEPIGVGGMAAVMRARDTQLDRIVALKILPPEMAEDDENVQRFHQEARAAAKLDHPNIAQVFFCGEDRGLHFIAFEFVEGDNLRTVMEKRGRLPVGESVRYVIQVAAGLDHAASRGVVHRDIKPSNIIITPNGAAKLVDMGLARSLERKADRGLTHSGMTLGTFDYISPEQALEPRDADARSDIYSLGCTFYHMLTGQPPVPEGTAAKKLHHHQHVAPIDPRQLNPAIPDEIAAILMRMMCKDPAGRYQQPAQLVQHLYHVAEQVGAGTNVPEGAMFLDAPLPGAPRFRPMLTVVLGGLALGVLLLLISLAPNTKGPDFNVQGNSNPSGDGPPPLPPKLKDPVAPTPITKGQGDKLKLALENASNTELNGDVNLNTRPITCNLDGNKTLLILGKGKQQRIHVKYQPNEKEEKDQVPCLTFKAEAGNLIRIENVCFELLDSGSLPESLIAVEGAGKVSFHKCTFKVTPSSKSSIREVASLLIRNLTGDPKAVPQVTLSECYFERGQVAVAVEGPVKLRATNCAFGLNKVQFAIRGECPVEDKLPPCDLVLSKCSAFVVHGPAFRFDGNYFCKLAVSNSIFSNPTNNESKEAQLIRLNTNDKMPLLYTGTNNRYHNLSCLLYNSADVNSPIVAVKLDQLISNLKLVKGEDHVSDNGSLVVPKSPSPWLYPLPTRLLEDNKPDKAFQLSRSMSEVRIYDKQNDVEKLVGIDACVWGEHQAARLDPIDTVKKTSPPPSNLHIVDPDAPDEDSLMTGVYAKLSKAVANLPKTGGVIKIKHGKASRIVAVDSIQLGKETQDSLTLRGDEKFPPVLTFADRPEESLFLLTKKFKGDLQFENLEFFLDSENDKVQDSFPIGIVTLISGRCSFKNCVFTMKRPNLGLKLSAVSFADNKNEMGNPQMMPASKEPPQITFTDCLIRGEGDLLTIRSGRPLDVQMTNTLLALAGSALAIDGDPVAAVANQEATSIKVSHVSGFVAEPFVRGKRMEALAPVRFETHDSLFVCMSPGQPFLSLPLEREDWKGGRNWYVNYLNMLEPKSKQMRERNDWKADFEADARFSGAAFSLPGFQYAEATLDHFKPDQFKAEPPVQTMLANYGANLDAKMLPPYTSSRKSAEAGTQ